MATFATWTCDIDVGKPIEETAHVGFGFGALTAAQSELTFCIFQEFCAQVASV